MQYQVRRHVAAVPSSILHTWWPAKLMTGSLVWGGSESRCDTVVYGWLGLLLQGQCAVGSCSLGKWRLVDRSLVVVVEVLSYGASKRVCSTNHFSFITHAALYLVGYPRRGEGVFPRWFLDMPFHNRRLFVIQFTVYRFPKCPLTLPELLRTQLSTVHVCVQLFLCMLRLDLYGAMHFTDESGSSALGRARQTTLNQSSLEGSFPMSILELRMHSGKIQLVCGNVYSQNWLCERNTKLCSRN